MTRPDFSGLWRLNLAKSRFPGVVYSAIGMKIEHNEPDFVQTLNVQFENGQVTHLRFAGNTAGAEFMNSFNNLPMRSTASWTGHELVIDSSVETGGGRPLHFRDHWSLSDDGSELFMEHRDDDIAGQLSVLERVRDFDGA